MLVWAIDEIDNEITNAYSERYLMSGWGQTWPYPVMFERRLTT